eukprot:jgi/Phyca11/119588/e_gw1.39.25.1
MQVAECDVPVYHGKGRLEFKTGFTYVGDFIHGRMHGTGRIEWHTSGVVYEGEFRHNEITGKGTYCNARYEGAWDNGLPHGYGELVFDAARNIRYEGQFIEGKRHGTGHMHYADGSAYIGDWKADVKCGRGVMTWMVPGAEDAVPLERYDGEWENDCQEGFGRHVWLLNPLNAKSGTANNPHDKNWYEGEFHEGLRHGRGVFFYANGARYEGEWKANVKEGYGMFFYEDGRVFVGLF